LHYRSLVDLLVIGGSGFLGPRITRQAQLAGHSVTATFGTHVQPITGMEKCSTFGAATTSQR
jgi:hypothetical protein